MKRVFLGALLFGVLGIGSRDLHGQVYGPYYYGAYWDAQYQHYLQWQQYLQYLQLHDPYYELHVMHYQLYMQPYQPYVAYPPCCYVVGMPVWPTPAGAVRRRELGPRPRIDLTPRFQTGVGSLPQATAPLPRAAGPLPRATARR